MNFHEHEFIFLVRDLRYFVRKFRFGAAEGFTFQNAQHPKGLILRTQLRRATLRSFLCKNTEHLFAQVMPL